MEEDAVKEEEDMANKTVENKETSSKIGEMTITSLYMYVLLSISLYDCYLDTANNITNIRYSHSNYSQFDFARCRRREAFRRLRRLELRGTNC